MQRDKLVLQNQHLLHIVDDTCRCVPELAITTDLLVEVLIHSLANGVRDAREEMTRVQLALNIQITKLWLKVQPSTPLEIKE